MEIIKTKEKDGYAIFAVKGRLDALTAADFNLMVEERIKTGLDRLTFDLSELDYISSAGLRAILSTAKQLQARGGELRLAALQPGVATVFKVSGFDKIIPILKHPEDD